MMQSPQMDASKVRDFGCSMSLHFTYVDWHISLSLSSKKCHAILAEFGIQNLTCPAAGSSLVLIFSPEVQWEKSRSNMTYMYSVTNALCHIHWEFVLS